MGNESFGRSIRHAYVKTGQRRNCPIISIKYRQQFPQGLESEMTEGARSRIEIEWGTGSGGRGHVSEKMMSDEANMEARRLGLGGGVGG